MEAMPLSFLLLKIEDMCTVKPLVGSEGLWGEFLRFAEILRVLSTRNKPSCPQQNRNGRRVMAVGVETILGFGLEPWGGKMLGQERTKQERNDAG